jgi:predicted nucleic acid-binding protein
VIVLDASAAIEWLLQTRLGQLIEARLFRAGETLHAPHLLDVEVAQVLRRFAAAGRISPERGRDALDDLTDLTAVRYPHQVLFTRIWELRENLTAYDATYVALAEALGAVLVTCDRGLAAAPGHRAEVEVFRPA